MTPEMKLRCLHGAKDLYVKASSIINDFDLQVEAFNAASLLERVATDCECKPGFPVCPACIELAEIIYKDNPFPIEGEI